MLLAGLIVPALSACGQRKPIVASGPDEPASEYIIGPGDVLSISVYEAPPLSVSDLPVRPDGRISVPLAADLQAAGKTPSELGHDIELKLKQYVQNPNVTVMVRTFQGPADRQVRVIGEAIDPQAIPYRQSLTLLDVMIATRGLTKFAAGNSAVIVRHEGNKQQKIKVAAFGPDQGWRHQPERRDASRRYADHSAKLVLRFWACFSGPIRSSGHPGASLRAVPCRAGRGSEWIACAKWLPATAGLRGTGAGGA